MFNNSRELRKNRLIATNELASYVARIFSIFCPKRIGFQREKKKVELNFLRTAKGKSNIPKKNIKIAYNLKINSI